MLDQASLAHLDDAQRQRYMTLERLFDTDGWKLLVEFSKSNAGLQEQRIINAQNWETHRHASGARAVYLQFANLQEQFEQEFSAIAEEAANRVRLVEETDFE